jgi:hypothetical protein
LPRLALADMHGRKSNQGVSNKPAVANTCVSKQCLSEERSGPMEITLL